MAKFKKSNRKKPNKKRSFSSEQKRAYYMGLGVGMGTIPLDDDDSYYKIKKKYVKTLKGLESFSDGQDRCSKLYFSEKDKKGK